MPAFPRPSCMNPVASDAAQAGSAAAKSAAWQGILDAGSLARLSELDPKGQAGLVMRVVTTYTQSLRRLLGELARARASADLEAMRHVAHTLKSSSASVGALQLSALCAEIERDVRDRQTDGLDTRLDAMAREGGRVLAALDPAPADPLLTS